LEKIFGWEGVEARLLLHWRLGAFSGPTISFSRRLPRSELRVEGGWTLALVEHLVNRGLIDRAVAEEAYAKLVGFNYQITHFRGSVIVAALRVRTFERLGRCFPDAPDDPSFRTVGGLRRSSEHGTPHARRVRPEVVVGAAPARDKVQGD
jgi:hypothetical protein